MDDPNVWPDEARKKALLAAATRMRDACQWGGPPEDWLHDAERILNHDFGDLIAARVAEARAKALEEAADVAGCDYVTEPDAAGRQFVIRHGDPGIADAIRALQEEGDDR